MIRRIPTLLVALAGVVLAGGCATFTEADVVARVGDAELTRDDLSDLVGDTSEELGQVFQVAAGEDTGDGTISSDLAGNVLSVWMESQLLHGAIAEAGGEVTDDDIEQARQTLDPDAEGSPFADLTDPFLDMVAEYQAASTVWNGLHTTEPESDFDRETTRAEYEQGMDASGIACLGAIVTASQDDADEAVADIRGGADFTSVAEEVTVESQTALGCRPAMELQSLGEDIIAEISALDVAPGSVTDPIETPGPDGTAMWIVLGHLPFNEVVDELEAQSMQQAQQTAQQAAQQAARDDFEAYAADSEHELHPRYGTYTPMSGVEPLGGTAPSGDVAWDDVADLQS